ncbi:DoxX family protein [Nitritalea halalkaliphila LW7]|uniref:DoxX family protein n=1 Tax=Nitritalea halalkaliphila LW7 TaxID=1189621 RepID=I5BYV2_9BACT|nr:DoxX family protein [Nitritalea halalkaliphila]EIM74754.1 DoxX family protein [Nitritalea halalkaliphila LW7]
MKKILFSSKPFFSGIALSLLRIGSALMMLTHGWAKIANFTTNLERFPDPIGLGPAVSLQLAIFAEFFCAILLLLGFMSRIALIPLIITMVVAAFVVHGADPFPQQEKSLLFLLIFVIQFLAGPGTLSLDKQLLPRRR